MNNGKYFYLCDGKACSRNCAETGFSECIHTKNEAHAKNKIRRERKMVKEGSFMVEKEE